VNAGRRATNPVALGTPNIFGPHMANYKKITKICQREYVPRYILLECFTKIEICRAPPFLVGETPLLAHNRAIECSNSLPISIINCPSVRSFKNNLTDIDLLPFLVGNCYV
jgi:hypothetical protein